MCMYVGCEFRPCERCSIEKKQLRATEQSASIPICAVPLASDSSSADPFTNTYFFLCPVLVNVSD